MSGEAKFSYLVFEKNAKSEVFEAELVVKMLEDQKAKLKNWVEKLLESQERLIRKVEKYKRQLSQEVQARMKLEKYLRDLEHCSQSVERELVGYSKESHEEVMMNTSKLLVKVRANGPISEIFYEKIGPDQFFGLVKEFKLDQAFIRLAQIVCEIISCTSSVPGNL